MSRALTIQLNIPGQWRDIWLYKERVYIWDRQGVIYHADVEAIRKHLAKAYGSHIALLAQILVFRNDWKVGDPLRLMLDIPAVDAAVLSPFAERERVTLVIPRSLFTPGETQPYAGLVLDTCIYANRLYLATLDGLLESYVHPRYPDRAYPLSPLLDKRVSRLAVKYAAINAAAEDEGLFFGKILFGGSAAEENPAFDAVDFRQIADFSLSVSHASRNILNYTDDSVPSLYRAEVEKVSSPGMAYDDHRVVDYQEASDLTALAQSALASSDPSISSRRASEIDVQVLGNSNYHLLASVDDKLRVLNLSAFEDQDVKVKRNTAFVGAERAHLDVSEMLATYPINGGFIVETEDSVRLVGKEGSFELLAGESARVRTFTTSRRFKEAVAVVQEEAAYLVGYRVVQDLLI